MVPFPVGLMKCFVESDALKIHGDDTPALQAVLDADVWRKHLLGEQEVSLVVPSHFSNAHVSIEDK